MPNSLMMVKIMAKTKWGNALRATEKAPIVPSVILGMPEDVRAFSWPLKSGLMKFEVRWNEPEGANNAVTSYSVEFSIDNRVVTNDKVSEPIVAIDDT